jgi:hypothetical protein
MPDPILAIQVLSALSAIAAAWAGFLYGRLYP